MILHFEFRADVNHWRVRVVETGFVRDDANLMAFDARGRIAAIGEQPRELGAADAARAAPIYDALRFDPAATAASLRYYTMVAHQSRRGPARILDLFDRYDLMLELPGYSEIAAGLRANFEKELYAMTFVRSYSINGRKRRLPWNLFRWR